MSTSQKKTLLDYMSQNSENDKENQVKPKQVVNEKPETPKKAKITRKLVDVSESSSGVENFTDSAVFENEDKNTDITGNCSFIEKFENRCNIINEERKPKISKVIAEFLEADTKEFTQQEPGDEQEEERYQFLVEIRDKEGRSKDEEHYDPTTLHIPKKYYDKFSPFEKQFWDIKREHFDTVIFFKKGKFYELYENDADIASRLFDLRVSERVNMRMAGVPESSYESWAAKFIEKGYKIGRVDQSENAIGKKLREQDGKKDKIINRELKEIITPSTIYNTEHIRTCFPVYLAVLKQHNQCQEVCCTGPCHFSILLYDSCTNQIFVKTFCDSYDCNMLKTIFIQNEIKEIITEEKIILKTGVSLSNPIKTVLVSPKKYDFKNENEFECFTYLYNHMKALCRASSLDHALILPITEECDFIALDGSTLINLDILTNNFDNSTDYTLFKAINNCHTAFGQRLLRKWIVAPLKNIEMINERRRLAKIFENNDNDELIEYLKSLVDIERLMGKLSNGSSNAKDASVFIKSLRKVQSIFDLLMNIIQDHDKKHADFIKHHQKFLTELLCSFDALYHVTDTEILPGDANSQLQEYNICLINIKKDLDKILEKAKSVVNCTNLVYRSIGKEIFQIEAPADILFPQSYYLVSSTKNYKRYYNKELKCVIEKHVEIEEKMFQIKGSIVRNAIEYLNTFSLGIASLVSFLASIDCLISFSIFNTQNKTSVPEFSEKLKLINFTNPVYPHYIRNNYTPQNTVTLVTGPNMGGKSTFLRSICLNIILAQMGLNVCSEYMSLPVFDKIFTRIGASDSLAKGESTFMVEMNEAAKIVNFSTKNSFVIMDELGRGTSTKDGEAIALAVLDALKETGCYSLFSTHYHRLCETCKNVDRSYVKCKLESQDITFLYKVEEGVCNDSHGLYVAKLAGIPDFIIQEAFKFKNSSNIEN